MKHRSALDEFPSIASSQAKQEVESFKQEINQASMETNSRVESLAAQVEAIKQEMNQNSVERKNSLTEIQSLKTELEALKQEVDATERVPKPFALNQAEPPANDLVFDTISIHGVQLEYAVRNKDHVADMHNQIKREINQFAILKDAIEQSTQQPPLVMDIQKANHGLYSLFAAKLGAEVIVIEPQEALCRVVLAAAKKNGLENLITVYHGAIWENYEAITMKDAGGNDYSIKVFPIYQFLSRGDTRRIACLKIDVEGFDLHVIPSAASLFAQKRVENVLVEFGPLEKWEEVAGDAPQVGLKMLKDLHGEYGMEPRVIEGWEKNVWQHFLTELGMISETRMTKAEESKYFRLATEKYRTLLMSALETMDEEAFLWLVPDGAEAEYPVFQSECSSSREGKEVLASGGVMLTSFGCATNDGTDADAAPDVRL